MNKPIVGTYWTRNGDMFRKGIPGVEVRVLAERDFRAQYRIR